MKFRTKLYVGFGIKLLLILALTIVMIVTVNKLNHTTNDIVMKRYEYVKLTTNIRNDLSDIDRSLSNIVMSDNEKEIEKNIQNIYKHRNDANESMKQLKRIIIIQDIKSQYNKLKDLIDSYEIIGNDVISLASKGDKIQARTMMLESALQTRIELFDAIESLNHTQENLMERALAVASQTYQQAVQNGFIIMFLSLVIGVGVTYWVIRSITGSFKKITAVFSKIDIHSTGHHLPRLEVISHDEIGEFSAAFNQMATSLEERAQKESSLRQQMLDQNWLDSKMADITMMYQGVADIKKLTLLVITKLTPLIDATYGVFYIRKKDHTIDQLVNIASYAGVHNSAKEIIQIGEGLVGQCAFENKKMLLTKIPDGYIKISSGLGEAKPAHLLLLPIEFKGNVIGVLEFASFQPFLSTHHMLLDRVLRSLGITMESIKNYMGIQRLLEESQTLTEELQSQSEELQLQQEELKSINEKLEEQYHNSEAKTRELEHIKIKLEKQTSKLTVSSEYKSQFLANMSHELRTPLNSLLILAQILAENCDGNLTEKQIEYAKTISSSGYDLLNLINDILDLTKIESGKMDMVMEEVQIKDICQFVHQQFHLIAEKKGLDFTLIYSDHLPKIIQTDKQRLQQILANLLSNAFKFTKHGRVEFMINRSDKSLINDQDMLAISVKDTGIGIPKNKQDIIFEAFQQADGTTSRNFGGTGLGLSISRELANLLGGFIEVDSAEGVGSTFTLYLPLLKEDYENTAVHEVAVGIENGLKEEVQNIHDEELMSNKKVLIIDDDMRNVFALTTILESHNIYVAFAENGRDGIKILDRNPHFDLILMDIMMPVMDGYAAMKEIRSNSKYSKIPIIALTAKAMRSDKEKCIEAGATDYISKPINVEKLFSLMKVWLNR